ncbi:MAG TPA: hypothetical protein VMS64_06925 [Candidatus Methylomirabilis sp.]|nr:hypothetical protein [Candidatus Methylomirabilis sp.]
MKIRSKVLIALALLMAGGCAGGVGPATVAPTVDITGKWVGSWAATNPSLGSGTITMNVKQTGPQYSGTLLMTGTLTDPSGPTEGVVSGNQVRFTRPPSVTGSLTVQGDTMSGNIFGLIDANATLKRQ